MNKIIKAKSQTITDFLKWLEQEKEIKLCVLSDNFDLKEDEVVEIYEPIYMPIEDLINEYFT